MALTAQDFQALLDTVDTWNIKKREISAKWNGGTSGRSLRDFVEVMNYHTKRMVSLTGRNDAEFWEGLFELANHGHSVVKGAKVFVDGVDRTND